MKIFVSPGPWRTFTFNVSPSACTSDIKELPENTESIPCNQQILMFGGKRLQDNDKLSDYGIENETTIRLAFRLRG
ncbi:ubiquitin-related domain-containing protein, partial [Armillaria luteobubalina]